MKEENESKVYARSNFDLNKVTSTPVAPKIASNNLAAKPDSLNFIMTEEDPHINTSNPSNDDAPSDEHNNSHAA
jgi:hypothetical protein